MANKVHVKHSPGGSTLMSRKPFAGGNPKPKMVYARPVNGGIIFSDKPNPGKTWSKLHIQPDKVYDGIAGGVILQQAGRTEHAQEVDLGLKAGTQDTMRAKKWHPRPNRVDIPGVDVRQPEMDFGQKWLAKVKDQTQETIALTEADKEEAYKQAKEKAYQEALSLADPKGFLNKAIDTLSDKFKISEGTAEDLLKKASNQLHGNLMKAEDALTGKLNKAVAESQTPANFAKAAYDIGLPAHPGQDDNFEVWLKKQPLSKWPQYQKEWHDAYQIEAKKLHYAAEEKAIDKAKAMAAGGYSLPYIKEQVGKEYKALSNYEVNKIVMDAHDEYQASKAAKLMGWNAFPETSQFGILKDVQEWAEAGNGTEIIKEKLDAKYNVDTSFPSLAKAIDVRVEAAQNKHISGVTQSNEAIANKEAAALKADQSKTEAEAQQAANIMAKGVKTTSTAKKKGKHTDWEYNPTEKDLTPDKYGTGRPYFTNDIDWVAEKFGHKDLGKPFHSPSLIKSNPHYLYAGPKQGVLTDGYLVVAKQQAIDDIVPKAVAAYEKTTGPATIEATKAHSIASIKDMAYLKPEGAHPVHVGAVQVINNSASRIVWFTDGDHDWAVDADKLAFVHKYVKGAKTMAHGPGEPILFVEDGKMVGAVMPMAIQPSTAVKDGLNGQTTPLKVEPTAQSTPIAKTVEKVAEKTITPPKPKVARNDALAKNEKAIKEGNKDWKTDLEQLSGKKGTNDGGLFKDKLTGVMYYVKFTDEDHARAESLASRLYELAGAPVPQVDAIKWGDKWAVKSEWIDKLQPMSLAQMQKHQDIQKHYIADAWLANWDVIGASNDNVALAPDGKAYRLDLGGSLIWRAQGKFKSFEKDEVPELQSMANTSYPAGKVFAGMTLAEQKVSCKAISDITDGQIDEIVDEIIPDKEYNIPGMAKGVKLNSYYKTALKSRRDWLTQHVLKYEPPKPLTPEELATLSHLKPENAALVVNSKAWKPEVDNEKEKIQRKVMESQLGVSNGDAALESLKKTYGNWKGSSNSGGGMILRWAAAHNLQLDDSVWAALKDWWKHDGENPDVKAKQLQSEVEKYGPATSNGVAVNREMHSVYLRNLHNAKDPNAKISIYRAWRPDQVQKYGWQKAQSGDKIEVLSPVMFSFTFTKSVSNNFYGGGGKLVKVDVPISDVMLSDRMTNMNGGYSHEDEVLFVVPKGYTMEVIK